MNSYRNKFVIKKETGHPGYSSITILATRRDLAALADEIKLKLAEGYQPPFVSHYATEAHGKSSRVYLQFEPASESELDDLHKNKGTLRSGVFSCALMVVVILFAILGVLSVWSWLTGGNW
jgi:hypothetical protein